MIDKNYHANALKTYGEACEICGHRTSLEVHHIGYQEHQAIEDKLKKTALPQLINEAIALGFNEWNPKTKQLSKDDSTKNLSVLCGNCHSLCHTIDYGMSILKALKERR